MLRNLLLWVIALASLASAQETRHFTFHYGFTVKNLLVGDKVQIWFPAAHSDAFQEVKIVSATGDLPLKKTREGKYGNEIYYAETSKSKLMDLHFEVVYEVLRRERLTLGTYSPHLEDVKLADKERKISLAPDKLVPVTGLPAELAAKAVNGKATPMEKARAIYDDVFAMMRYDKSGTGWGRGDVLYAGEAKKGNCTDFHSLFIAMARSQGVPARFGIGFSLPPDKHAAEIGEYHCWADFFEPTRGWIPVDISEAWKHPEKRDYFFGAHDDNRVQFTLGRDLVLNPKQEGEPLNYFVYPYVEVGGRAFPNVTTDFSFADAGSISASTGR